MSLHCWGKWDDYYVYFQSILRQRRSSANSQDWVGVGSKLPCLVCLFDLLCLYGGIVVLVVVVFLFQLSILSSMSSSVLPLLTTACLVCPVRSTHTMRSPVLFVLVHSFLCLVLPSFSSLGSTRLNKKRPERSTRQHHATQPTDRSGK